ncbi:MAG: peptidylprolyl isomerase, partial [Bacteroidales bacterium]|nr:peptidylprolyl isomerase [Bacteroidales bacterium]
MKRMTILAALITLSMGVVHGQLILDRIVAVVGEHRILQSDIETQYLQNKAQGISMPENPKCWLLEENLGQKLLVNQAKIDSVEVSEANVEMELDGRLSYFIGMIGSPEALEEYFGKSILQIKADMRESVRENIIQRQMQAT